MVRQGSLVGAGPTDKLELTLGGLYQAAVDDGAWPAALTTLGDLTSSIGGHLLIWDKMSRTPLDSFMGDRFPEVNPVYLAYYGAIDPRLQLVMTMPVGKVFACHHHFDADFVRHNEFYNDFLLPNDARYVAGCRLLETDGLTAILGLHRSPRHEPFENADIEQLERLLPHLARAVTVRERLRAAETESAITQAALDRMTTAVIVVTDAGVVRVMNDAARQLVRLGDALLLRRGRLSARRQAEEALLLGLIVDAANAAARGGAGGGSVALSREHGGSYATLVVPLQPGHEAVPAEEPAALVLLTDPAATSPTFGRTLVDLYGLSQAEARLAVLLAQDLTLREAADERGVGIETVRSQLRSVLHKCGVHRQADLVRLLARLPAARAVPNG